MSDDPTTPARKTTARKTATPRTPAKRTPAEKWADNLAEQGGSKRIDRIEHDVKNLHSSVVAVTTEVKNISRVQNETSTKIDQLLERSSSTMAVKGMVPAQYITWSISAFIALLGIGLTMLALAAGFIRSDIKASEDLIKRDIDRLAETSELRFKHVQTEMDRLGSGEPKKDSTAKAMPRALPVTP